MDQNSSLVVDFSHQTKSSPFVVEVRGDSVFITEVAQILGWLGAGLMTASSDASGIMHCWPEISQDSQTRNPDGSATRLDIEFSLHDDSQIHSGQGHCWKHLFHNPVIVQGYSVPRRPGETRSSPGIEIPLNVMAELVGSTRITGFSGSVVIKGFSDMLVLTKIIEGCSGTTGTVVPVLVLLLMSNPPAYRKLQQEIDGVVAAGLDTPIISDAQAKTLTYLQAVIKESLRCFPPIPALSPKRTSKATTLCGKYLPPNTEVSWCAWGIMKNKAVFGPDAEIFNPERWLTTDVEKLKAMDDIQSLVFMSKSRWQCLGKAFAYQELGKLIFEVCLAAPGCEHRIGRD